MSLGHPTVLAGQSGLQSAGIGEDGRNRFAEGNECVDHD
jgi:hypothetical protein